MYSGTYTVLLVDDDENLLLGLKRRLKSKICKIITAVSAAEAIGHLQSYDIDLVLCDYKMPGTNGMELLEILKSTYPDVLRMMLSGCIGSDNAWKVVEEIGVSHFFSKPSDASKIAQVIDLAIEKKANVSVSV
ncbi:MAG: response regulator [Planctomycetes bacterium]|nr:response regulator [Planctomycetota bacterium]